MKFDHDKLFDEITAALQPLFEPGGDMPDAHIKRNEKRLSVCSRTNDRLFYGRLVADHTMWRVEVHSRAWRRPRRFKVITTAKLLASLREAVVAGRLFEERRADRVYTHKTLVARAQRALTDAGIQNASNIAPPPASDGVHRVWIDPSLSTGCVELRYRAHSHAILCVPERAAAAARALIALDDAFCAFEAARALFKNEPVLEMQATHELSEYERSLVGKLFKSCDKHYRLVGFRFNDGPWMIETTGTEPPRTVSIRAIGRTFHEVKEGPER